MQARTRLLRQCRAARSSDPQLSRRRTGPPGRASGGEIPPAGSAARQVRTTRFRPEGARDRRRRRCRARAIAASTARAQREESLLVTRERPARDIREVSAVGAQLQASSSEPGHRGRLDPASPAASRCHLRPPEPTQRDRRQDARQFRPLDGDAVPLQNQPGVERQDLGRRPGSTAGSHLGTVVQAAQDAGLAQVGGQDEAAGRQVRDATVDWNSRVGFPGPVGSMSRGLAQEVILAELSAGSDVGKPSRHSSARWQATWRPWPKSRNGGTSVRQRSTASVQRATNGQPGAAATGKITVGAARRERSRRARAGSTSGTESIRRRVYGCNGAPEERLARARFHDAAAIHDENALGQARDDGQVVADEEACQVRDRAGCARSG